MGVDDERSKDGQHTGKIEALLDLLGPLFKAPVTLNQKLVGVALLFLLVFFGWVHHDASPPSDAGVLPLLGAVVMPLVASWAVVFVIAVVFVFLETVVIRMMLLEKGTGASSGIQSMRMPSLQTAFVWLFDPLLRTALLTSVVVTLSFAFVYAFYMYLVHRYLGARKTQADKEAEAMTGKVADVPPATALFAFQIVALGLLCARALV